MIFFWVSPILQLKWGGVNKEKIQDHIIVSPLSQILEFFTNLASFSGLSKIRIWTCAHDEWSHANKSALDLPQGWAERRTLSKNGRDGPAATGSSW